MFILPFCGFSLGLVYYCFTNIIGLIISHSVRGRQDLDPAILSRVPLRIEFGRPDAQLLEIQVSSDDIPS
jgi:hypothetical protein